MIDLTGKKALVTGSGTGIGKGIALELAEAGADVVIHYKNNSDGAEKVVKQIKEMGRNSIAVRADVLIEDDIKQLIKETATFSDQKLDILVNNAGHLVERSPIAEMSTDLWHQIMDVNITSTFLVTKHAIPIMNEAGGRIVNMASLASHNGGGPGAVAYATSKGAVDSFSKGLAKELAPKNITVNTLSPGFIDDTPFHTTFNTEEGRANAVKSIPLQRGGYPKDVAGATLYLVSDLASFITGESIEINGGMYMR